MQTGRHVRARPTPGGWPGARRRRDATCVARGPAAGHLRGRHRRSDTTGRCRHQLLSAQGPARSSRRWYAGTPSPPGVDLERGAGRPGRQDPSCRRNRCGRETGRRGARLVAGEVIPLTGMRGVIASRMHASLQEMAQLTLGTDATMDAARRPAGPAQGTVVSGRARGADDHRLHRAGGGLGAARASAAERVGAASRASTSSPRSTSG